MSEFKYKASIIVPIYNVEKFLAGCLESLLQQTIPKGEMEIVLVNDGSPDSSDEICKRYAAKYDFIHYYVKENGGLSSARNYGIQKAQGKYFFYLDSDDTLTPDTVRAVTDFFDTVYDQVDMVAYYIVQHKNGKCYGAHFRFTYDLTQTGVYDLNEHPYITQTNVNVCVKNLGKDNVLFDTTPGFIQEDQEYNNRILMRKMKIGYCKEGCYLYNRNNDSSISSTRFHAYFLFEKSLAYFESLFAQFPDKVPQYFQGMFLNDIRWKLSQDLLYPYHYEKDDFDRAVNRIKALLSRVDSSMIVGDKIMQPCFKYYWLRQKPNAFVTRYIGEDCHGLMLDGEFVYQSQTMDVEIVRFQQLDNGKLLLRAYLRSFLFDFSNDEPEVWANENGERKKVSLYLSKYGFENISIPVNRFFAFEHEIDPENTRTLKFEIRFCGYNIPVKYTFSPFAVMRRNQRFYCFVCGRAKIKYRSGAFYINPVTTRQADVLDRKNTRRLFFTKEEKRLRYEAIKYRKNKKIWLYNDLYTVRKDNGYYQFINDFKHKDGVERYYVCTRPIEEMLPLFTPEQSKFLVQFGSHKHKLLYLSAQLIFTAYYGRAPISPFEDEQDEHQFYDIEHFRVIYLQHGVLHASLYIHNSAENARADKVVVSSYFEKENYAKKYHYRPDMLVPTGMARYDHINKQKKPKGVILYAPSWRKYLTESVGTSHWNVQEGKIASSQYCKNMRAFVESEDLGALLEKYDMRLELKLHPIIAGETSLFNFKSDRITYAEKEVEIEDYDVFITDFSSFVFDYAYLNRPILYYVTDFEQWKSGMGHYRELDLPFEKAFGTLTVDHNSAIKELGKILQNGCKPEKVYFERMEKFYVPMDGNCAEGLYKYVTENMI